MKIIIDSYGWIEYFAQAKNAEKYEKWVVKANREENVLPAIIVYEVFRKIKETEGEDKANETIAQIMARNEIVKIDENLAIDAADISIEKKLPMADAIIYATAKRKNAKIITSDRHFKGLENVEFI